MSKLVSPFEMYLFLLSLPKEALEKESRDVKEYLSRVSIDWYAEGYKQGYNQGYDIKDVDISALTPEQQQEYKDGELQGSIRYWADVDSEEDW